MTGLINLIVRQKFVYSINVRENGWPLSRHNWDYREFDDYEVYYDISNVKMWKVIIKQKIHSYELS